MQLYARDSNGHAVFADHALKQQDYFCLECQEVVHVRGGLHRQNHFFHLKAHHSCSMHAKSMTHIQVQCRLQDLFTSEQCSLEHPFPEINRIADVVWHPHRLVFEVQCSPISAEEVQKRNEDYASMGFQTVWILHENRFNQFRLSAAEHALKFSPHYYTNINADGQGMIYDQFSLYLRGIRRAQLDSSEVSISSPFFISPMEKNRIKQQSQIPKYISQRIAHASLCFSGDLIWKCLSNSTNWDQLSAFDYLDMKKQESRRPLEIFLHPYRLLFNHILEKMCK